MVKHSYSTVLLVVSSIGSAYATMVPSSVINSGGGQAVSTAYVTHSSVGQFSSVMLSGSSHKVLAGAFSIKDTDTDGFVDLVDNCLFDINNQADNDIDMMGDVCDVDDDNDGLTDAAELIAGTNPFLEDTDGDGFLDGVDPAPLIAHLKGDVAPYGGTDGLLSGGDLVVMLRMVLGDLPPTPDDIIRGDLYPSSAPDGVLSVQDLILLEQLVIP